ncbi:MAG: glycerophosphodiester phosphodiesterase family protein, partial [Dehalococcoidia bacterium]
MGTMPENTLAGVDAAIRDGADGVEIDVRATADGHVVLLHD